MSGTGDWIDKTKLHKKFIKRFKLSKYKAYKVIAYISLTVHAISYLESHVVPRSLLLVLNLSQHWNLIEFFPRYQRPDDPLRLPGRLGHSDHLRRRHNDVARDVVFAEELLWKFVKDLQERKKLTPPENLLSNTVQKTNLKLVEPCGRIRDDGQLACQLVK